MYKLSEGSLDNIISGNQSIEQPVLQLLDYKKLRSDTSDQYKLVVSDGIKKYQHTMLSTGLNYLFENGTFTKYAVFKVLNYDMKSTDEEKKVLTIIDGEVLFPAKEVQRMIGNPTENEVLPASDKPRSSAVHHEVMEDTMQLPSTSKDTYNFSFRKFTVPIKTLNPQNRKPIKAQVTNKSPIETCDRGKFFSMQLVDDSDKIRCVAFNDECDEFYDKLENNKVYRILNYKLQTMDKQSDKLENHYEIVIANDTEIEESHDDASTQSTHFNHNVELYPNYDTKLRIFPTTTEMKLVPEPYSLNLFAVVATIDAITDYSIYKACPKISCKKKLVSLSFNKFKCEKCVEEYTNFNYGLVLHMNILDSTDSYYVIAFNDIAEDILGMSAQALGELKEDGYNAYKEIIDDVISKKYRFFLRKKTDIFQGKTRMYYICASIAPFDQADSMRSITYDEITKRFINL